MFILHQKNIHVIYIYLACIIILYHNNKSKKVTLLVIIYNC